MPAHSHRIEPEAQQDDVARTSFCRRLRGGSGIRIVVGWLGGSPENPKVLVHTSSQEPSQSRAKSFITAILQSMNPCHTAT